MRVQERLFGQCAWSQSPQRYVNFRNVHISINLVRNNGPWRLPDESLGHCEHHKGIDRLIHLPPEPIPFIRSEDLEVYQANRDAAFEVQVGIHELLGHGTGKLLQETSPGTFNFDKENPPISPITNKPISTWYKSSETYSSVFGPTASSYEECRAGNLFPLLPIPSNFNAKHHDVRE